MMEKTIRALFLALIASGVGACGGGAPTRTAEESPLAGGVETVEESRATPIAVRVIAARRGPFPLRTVATGVLRAARQAEIRLRVGGVIVELPVVEGRYVEKGALLARVDEAPLLTRLEEARLQLDEARINKDDLLVAQGGRAGVDTSVSAGRLRNIHTISGYDKAKLAVRQAEYELSLAPARAPFSGLVANIEARLHQQANAGDPLCALIDPASFEAEFQLLEQEASQARPGRRVRVRPLAIDREFLADISAVNPVVNEHGLVTVRARLRAAPRDLFEGMNVEVIIEQDVPGQIIVPKSAVVLRSGRPVVFTYNETEKLAKWNYVRLVFENDREVALGEGLGPGDLVIFEGNLNLDHDAEVRIENEL
jgi:RND family efflux transporter MFP subunit